MSELLAAADPAAAPVVPLTRTNTLARLTATAFLAHRESGACSALDYARACADRIEQLDPGLGAWKHFERDVLEARARRADDRFAQGERKPLCGVPVGVKDIFNTYDMPTGMGSPILDGYTPGNDARVVSNVRLEGGLVAGKTVTAEFAVHHPSGTRNPHDLARTPGTSSSGSAAAVAARMVPLAFASQTGGSTIRPASYCGIYGYKPSFGLLPRTGSLKTTDTLDTVGLMARSVDDLALLFEVTRVRGRNYPVSDAALSDQARQSVAGRRWRVGVVRGPKSSGEAAAPLTALERVAAALSRAGIEVGDYTLPAAFDTAHDIHETIYRRALAYYFKTEWQSQDGLFSDRLRRMIEGGLTLPVESYHQACARQTGLARLFDSEMGDRDVLIGLATADEAPAGLDAPEPDDHSLIWTLCGAPALSVPLLAGTGGLPGGVQIVARRFNDYLLLGFARRLVEIAGGAA